MDALTLKTGSSLFLGGTSVTAGVTGVVVYKEQIKNAIKKTLNLQEGIDGIGEKLKDMDIKITSPWVINTTFLGTWKFPGSNKSPLKNELYKTTNSVEEKTFKCKISDSKFDDDCNIYELTKNKNNLIDLSSINSSNKHFETIIENKKHYKLTISNASLKGVDLKTITKIDIVSKDDLNEVLGSLNINYMLKNNKVFGKTNIVLAKILSPTQTVETPNFLCSFQKQDSTSPTPEVCEIFKIGELDSNLKDLSLSVIKQKTETFDENKPNDYFVIVLENEIEISEFKKNNKKFILLKTGDSISQKFAIKALLSKTFDNFYHTNLSEIIFSDI